MSFLASVVAALQLKVDVSHTRVHSAATVECVSAGVAAFYCHAAMLLGALYCQHEGTADVSEHTPHLWSQRDSWKCTCFNAC